MLPNAYDPENEDQIARLLKLAGPRPSLNDDRMRRAREAAHAEWTRALWARERRRWRVAAAAAIAAGVLGSATWSWLSQPIPRGDRPDLATLQKVVGSVRMTRIGDQQPHDVDGRSERLKPGDRVDVAEGSRAAFELVDGTVVRLNSGTVVVFDSMNRLALERGTVYVASNPAARNGTIVVDTPFGLVRHVGTQFEVRLQIASLSVRVRQGEVVVERRDARWTSRAGEALVITPDHPVERSRIATSGPEWGWICTMAPEFTLEGARVSTFLQWVCREQGWRWEYEDAPTRRLAERAVLHGSIAGLTPEEALAAVLPASRLSSKLEGDRLIVSATKRAD